MENKTCAVEWCEKEVKSKGFCNNHYVMSRRGADPHTHIKGKRKIKTVKERFFYCVDKTSSELGCWLWTEGLSTKGYGRLSIGTGKDNRRPQAHRLSYELFVGEIPEDMQVDHRLNAEGCPRHCVNPAHLRLVTHKENQENRQGARKDSFSGYRGVFLDKKVKRPVWYVLVIHNRKHHRLYSYPIYELHVAAYHARNLRNELYTHNQMDR